MIVLLSAAGCGTSEAPRRTEPIADLHSDPVVKVLLEKNPAEGEALVRHMAASTDDTPVQATRRLQWYIRGTVVPAYVPLADDPSIEQYLRTTISELLELRARSYYRCYVFLYGERHDPETRMALLSTLSPQVVEAWQTATVRLIESAATVPVSIDEAAAWRVLDNIVIPALPAWHGERKMVLRDPVSRDIDRTAACDVTLDVYKEAVDLPGADGRLLRRYLLARQLIAGL